MASPIPTSTNSIIIANLPDWSSSTTNGDEPKHNIHSDILPSTFLESLRAVIEVHRDIVHWVPVRSFRRIFCVFKNADDAELVKCALNGCFFEGHPLEVYFGEDTPLKIQKKYLEPPVLEKNWLISPPGSPQEGWIQIEEDPPNKVALHEDIQAALDRLAKELEGSDEEDGDMKGVTGNVILDTTSLGGVQVIVNDWDEMDSPIDDNFGGRGIHNTKTSAEVVGRTPRPPVDP